MTAHHDSGTPRHGTRAHIRGDGCVGVNVEPTVNLVALVDWWFIKLHVHDAAGRQPGDSATLTELIRIDIQKSDRRHTEPPEELNSPSEQLAPSAMNRANISPRAGGIQTT